MITPGSSWVLALRASLRRVAASGNVLLVNSQTAGSSFVRRGASRCGIETVECQTAEIRYQQVLSSDSKKVPPDHCFESPIHDRLLCEQSDELIVLNLRKGGNWHSLLKERLETGRRGVILVDLPDLEGASVRTELVKLGAVLWNPGDTEGLPFSVCGSEQSVVTAGDLAQKQGMIQKVGRKHCAKLPAGHSGNDTRSLVEPCQQQTSDGRRIVELVPFPSAENWSFLSHSTRACPGPWPDQTEDDYIDSLFDDRSDSDHSSLMTLERIINSRRLIAAKRIARGGHSVVSFTSVPLIEIPSLRIYRHHRTRWDFEPYGICIRKEWLIERAARPVIYGDKATWKTLNESDRPYFQPKRSGEKEHSAELGPDKVDWSIEKEWRHYGDVDLTSLAENDAMLFVPNYAAAKYLATVSPWPITLWPDPGFA